MLLLMQVSSIGFAAETIFISTQRSRHLIVEEQFNSVLAVYASEGDAAHADAFVAKFLIGQ